MHSALVWSLASPFLAPVPGYSAATAQANGMNFTLNINMTDGPDTNYEEIAQQIVTANPDVLMRKRFFALPSFLLNS
jgi:hypothetical protein